MASGIYNSIVTWQQFVGEKDQTYGEVEDGYRNRGSLYCHIRELSGTNSEEFDAVQYQTLATIRVHEIPGIGGQDVLVDNWSNRWAIDSLFVDRVKNETVLACHRFETGELV